MSIDSQQATEALIQRIEWQVALPELTAAIRRVPGLELTVRQRANASCHGLPKTIQNLEHAVVFLGLSQLRQIAEDQLRPTRSTVEPPIRESA
jgi:c-di-GMP-related signal transduction protein